MVHNYCWHCTPPWSHNPMHIDLRAGTISSHPPLPCRSGSDLSSYNQHLSNSYSAVTLNTTSMTAAKNIAANYKMHGKHTPLLCSALWIHNTSSKTSGEITAFIQETKHLIFLIWRRCWFIWSNLSKDKAVLQTNMYKNSKSLTVGPCFCDSPYQSPRVGNTGWIRGDGSLVQAQSELTLIGRANGDAFELELLNYNLTSACRPQLCLNTHAHTHTPTVSS